MPTVLSSDNADHMSVRQSGAVLWVLPDSLRGDGWGDVGGKWGICSHWVALCSHLSFAMRRFGDFEFHGADLILSKMIIDESSLLPASFSSYAISSVFSFSVHLCCFRQKILRGGSPKEVLEGSGDRSRGGCRWRVVSALRRNPQGLLL